jgi:hypothetical protein
MAKNKNRSISLAKLEEKYFGKKGTPKRNKYDKEFASEIAKEKKKRKAK